MMMPKQYVAFEVRRDETGRVTDIFPIREGLIVELEGGMYGQVLPTGELVQSFKQSDLKICPVMANG